MGWLMMLKVVLILVIEMLVDIFSSLDYYRDSGRELFQISFRYFGILFGGLIFCPYEFKF